MNEEDNKDFQATMTFNGQTINISDVNFVPNDEIKEDQKTYENINCSGSASGTMTMDKKSRRKLLKFIRKIYLKDFLRTFRWFRS